MLIIFSIKNALTYPQQKRTSAKMYELIPGDDLVLVRMFTLQLGHTIRIGSLPNMTWPNAGWMTVTVGTTATGAKIWIRRLDFVNTKSLLILLDDLIELKTSMLQTVTSDQIGLFLKDLGDKKTCKSSQKSGYYFGFFENLSSFKKKILLLILGVTLEKLGYLLFYRLVTLVTNNKY